MIQRFLSWVIGKTTSPLSPYQEAIARWGILSLPNHQVYQDIRMIEVLYPTIDVYIGEVNRLGHCLEKNYFYSMVETAELKQVPVNEFYLSAKRWFIDVPATQALLQQAAMDVLNLYERKSSEPNKSGLLQATLLRGAPLINNLFTLSEALSS